MVHGLDLADLRMDILHSMAFRLGVMFPRPFTYKGLAPQEGSHFLAPGRKASGLVKLQLAGLSV